MSIGMSRRLMLGLALGASVLAFALIAMAGSPPKAAAVTSECPAGDVCVWSGGTFGGLPEFIPGSETGCHSFPFEGHSARNHTGNKTVYFGSSSIGPGGEIDLNGVTSFCITG